MEAIALAFGASMKKLGTKINKGIKLGIISTISPDLGIRWRGLTLTLSFL